MTKPKNDSDSELILFSPTSRVSPLDGQISGPGCAHAEQHRVVIVLDLLGAHVLTDVDPSLEDNPLLGHQVKPPLDNLLRKLHGGDAIHQQAATPVVPLINSDTMTRLTKIKV